MIASAASKGETSPVPSEFCPQVAKVPGRNCAIPSAPADETAFGFQPDSTWSCAAMMAGVIVAQTAPAASTHGTYAAGISAVLTPSSPGAVTGCCPPTTDTSKINAIT